MNTNLKTFLKAIGFSVLALIIVNLIYFLIDLNKTDVTNSWNVALKHGAFSINGVLSGLPFGGSKANALMLVSFLYILYKQYKKRALHLKEN